MTQSDNTNVKTKSSQNNDALIRIIIYTSVVIIFIIATNFQKITNSINISSAEKCFAKQDYICAFKNYRNAFSNNIDNSKYVEHYFETLNKMKKIAIVQEELNSLLENYPDSSVVPQILATFSNMQTQINLKYPLTYIDNVVNGTNVVHWNNIESDINIFIHPNNSIPTFYITEVQKSFSDYSKVTGNLLVFKYVDTPAKANIEISFENNISSDECKNANNCSQILGLTENTITGGILKKSTIHLRIKDTDNTDFTPNKIHNIAKHEIGHSLGIIGHSYYADDVMYPVSNDSKFDKEEVAIKISKKAFSERDIQTLKLLYSIVPDITNKSYNIKKYPDMYYPIAVLGTKEEIGAKSLQESLTYYDTLETNFVSTMTLAEGFFANKNYQKASETFVTALHMAKTADEKAAVYNNLAVIAFQEDKYDKAIEYADMANTYDKDASSNEIKAYALIAINKKEEAQKLLEKLIQQHPDNTTFSAVLTDIYFKKLDFIKGFKELKRIKKENPKACDDDMYKNYKIFFNFV